MPLSQGNIGHCDVALFNAISHLNRFEAGTENPRVGGSIPPLAIFKSIFQIKKLHQSAWTFCLILSPVSNISVRCSLDQYDSRGGLESSCYGRSPRRILSARSKIVWGTTDI